MCLESVEVIVHCVQVLGICAVEPIGCDTLLVTLARFVDLTFCVTLFQESRIKFSNFDHVCIINEREQESTNLVTVSQLVGAAAIDKKSS